MVDARGVPGDRGAAGPGEHIPGFPAAEGPDGQKDYLKANTYVGWYKSDHERLISAKRGPSHKWAHAAPDSVLVWAIGNIWKVDAWHTVIDMCQYASDMGMTVRFQEGQNRCLEPYDAVGTMRNEAFAAASMGGFEYLLMIDNDVLPSKDTLYRLGQRDEPEVAPYVEEPKDPNQPGRPLRTLHGPFREPYKGIYNVKWHVLSMMLWKVPFIRNCGLDFWQDTIGGDEGYHFAKMYAQTGVYPKVDSEIVLPVAGAPLYPLTVHRAGEYEEVMKLRRAAYDSIPDRRPPYPGNGHVTDDGVYLAFLPDRNAPPPEEPPQGAAPEGMMSMEEVQTMQARVAEGKPLTLEQSRRIIGAAVPAQPQQESVNGSEPANAEEPAPVS